MNTLICSRPLLFPASIVIVLAWVTGCGAAPAQPPVNLNTPMHEMGDDHHDPTPKERGTTAVITAVHRLTPAAIKNFGYNEAQLTVVCKSTADDEVKDLADSRLFATVSTDPAAPADYAVKLESVRWASPDYKVTLTYELTDLRDHRQLGRGTVANIPSPQTTFKESLAAVMNGVKRAIAADLLRQQQEKEFQVALQRMEATPLTELINASDDTLPLAQARNHALIRAKTRQLPDLLRTSGTEPLTELMVKIEQTMLDLNHGAEVANDHAQRAAASADDSTQVDQLRGLAISYRERIALLKPIAAAIKEELANRNR